MSRQGLAVIVLCGLGVLIAGCGGSSESQLEKVEGEYKQVRSEVEANGKQSEQTHNSYYKASEVTEKLQQEELAAINADNMTKYRELQAAVNAAEANSQQQFQEASSQPGGAKQLEAREQQLAGEIETLKGCTAACQKERDVAVNQSVKCDVSMAKAGINTTEALAICRKRYPIPHENILHLQGE